MSYVTEPMSIARLRQIVNMSTAGLTPAQIARQLFDAGIPVPRAGGHPANWPDRGSSAVPSSAWRATGTGWSWCSTPQTFPESRRIQGERVRRAAAGAAGVVAVCSAR